MGENTIILSDTQKPFAYFQKTLSCLQNIGLGFDITDN